MTTFCFTIWIGPEATDKVWDASLERIHSLMEAGLTLGKTMPIDCLEWLNDNNTNYVLEYRFEEHRFNVIFDRLENRVFGLNDSNRFKTSTKPRVVLNLMYHIPDEQEALAFRLFNQDFEIRTLDAEG